MTTVPSVMAHNGRLPFPISSPACNRVDATSVDRISSFCRSRAGFLGSPDFHISPRSQSCCSLPLSVLFRCRPVPIYPSFSLPAATTVTGDYGKATRRDGDNGCIACVWGRDRRGVASMADEGGRDEERKMSGTRGEIDRERERESA